MKSAIRQKTLEKELLINPHQIDHSAVARALSVLATGTHDPVPDVGQFDNIAPSSFTTEFAMHQSAVTGIRVRRETQVMIDNI